MLTIIYADRRIQPSCIQKTRLHKMIVLIIYYRPCSINSIIMPLMKVSTAKTFDGKKFFETHVALVII